MASSRPRQPVAKGGLWSSGQQQNVSKETSDLLKVMMEESKLTNLQRRKLQESIQKGQSLPVGQSSSSTKPTKSKNSQKGPVVMNGRSLQYSGKRRKEVIDAIKEQQPKDNFKPTPGISASRKVVSCVCLAFIGVGLGLSAFGCSF